MACKIYKKTGRNNYIQPLKTDNIKKIVESDIKILHVTARAKKKPFNKRPVK